MTFLLGNKKDKLNNKDNKTTNRNFPTLRWGVTQIEVMEPKHLYNNPKVCRCSKKHSSSLVVILNQVLSDLVRPCP